MKVDMQTDYAKANIFGLHNLPRKNHSLDHKLDGPVRWEKEKEPKAHK